ncbi:MAG: hypothetical protein ABWY56_09305 [Propionibacteriaceae bacterium]
MLAGAGATAGSVYLHWLPCRTAWFTGTVLNGNRPSPEAADPEAWEACLGRMDTGLPFPYPPEPAETTVGASGLGVVAMALVGVAWMIFVLGMRWQWWTKAVASLPTAVTLVAAGVSAAAVYDTGRAEEDGSDWLWYGMDLAALVAFVAICAWQKDFRGQRLIRTMVVLWGVTAFGFTHLIFDYGFMATFSTLNWDTPPLTGTLSAASLALSAFVTVVVALNLPRKRLRQDRQPVAQPSRTLPA